MDVGWTVTIESDNDIARTYPCKVTPGGEPASETAHSWPSRSVTVRSSLIHLVGFHVAVLERLRQLGNRLWIGFTLDEGVIGRLVDGDCSGEGDKDRGEELEEENFHYVV